MKVLMISTDERIFESGASVRERMCLQGSVVDELHIIILTTNSTYRRQNIAPNVFIYPAFGFLKILALVRIVFVGIRLPVDMVTAQDPFETGLMAFKISFLKRIPLELQVHTDFLSPYFSAHSFKNSIRVFVAKILLPRADGIRVVSERIKHSLEKNSYLSKIPLIILPVFIELPRRVSSFSKNLHDTYPQFEKIILMASRLTSEKNIPLALRAFKGVLVERPKMGLVIVGSGPEKERLQKEARALNVEGNAIFEPWQGDLSAYYQSADIFLLTSFYEGFGLTLIESAFYGCPIVTTDVGEASFSLKNEAGALVYPVGDDSGITKGILRLATDATLGDRLKNEAKKSIQKFLIPKDAYLSKLKEGWQNTLQK